MQIKYTNFTPQYGIIYFVYLRYNNKETRECFALYQKEITLRKVPPKVKSVEIELIKELNTHGDNRKEQKPIHMAKE